MKSRSGRRTCQRHCLRFRLFAVLILWVNPLAATLAAASDVLPFQPGEKLVFELKWEVVSAGYATLEVLPMIEYQGKDVFHFAMTAKTNKYLDRIYKVRDRIDAYADRQLAHSVFYSQKQREGNYKRNILVKFDWDRREAVYNDILKDKKRKPIELLPGAFDPLSIFYYTRSLPLQAPMTIDRPVTDGKKCVVGKATVLKRETITVAAGTFDTLLMVPALEHIGGVFKKSQNAEISMWVTADEKRIPVKLTSKVVVGNFSAELVSYEY